MNAANDTAYGSTAYNQRLHGQPLFRRYHQTLTCPSPKAYYQQIASYFAQHAEIELTGSNLL